MLDSTNIKLDIPEKVQNKKPEFKLPPKKRFTRLFSPSVFKETVKSNWTSLLIVSLGNAFILILIIIILSTLQLNATKDSLSAMFGSADTESTIRSGAAGLYNVIDNSIVTYETQGKALGEQGPMLYDTTNQVISLVYDKTQADGLNAETKLGMNAVQIAYNQAYNNAYGNDAQRHASAKASVDETIDTLLKPYVSRSQLPLVKAIADEYLDVMHDNSSYSYQTAIEGAIPEAVKGYAVDSLGQDDKTAEVLRMQLANALLDYDAGKDSKAIAVDRSVESIVYLAGDVANGLATEDTVKTMATSLLNGYAANPVAYNANRKVSPTDKMGYQDQVLTGAIEDAIMAATADMAYWQSLPAFVVNYKTDELGRPVHFVASGKFDSHGNPVYVSAPITDPKFYDPSQMEPVDADMGLNANLLQKMHKYNLTGSEYTQAEIDKAKADAQTSLDTLRTNLDAFMVEYVNLPRDQNGSNEYYKISEISGEKQGTVNTTALSYKVAEKMVDMSTPTLLETYNVDSIDEITLANNGIEGSDLIATLKNYSVASISEFNRQYEDDQKLVGDPSQGGWTAMDAMTHSMVKATLGVMDQLPDSVRQSLNDMSTMNTYAIIVGMIFFQLAGLLIPIIYTSATANSLVAEKVETGSLAFTFSTPIKRNTFVFTQGFYMVCAQIVQFLVLFIGSIVARRVGIAMGSEDLVDSLDIVNLALFSFGGFVLMFAISGIDFFFSCWFNKTKMATGLSNGFSMYFLICAILGLFGGPAMPSTIRIEAMDVFNYVTIISLFDAQAVMDGDLLLFFLKLIPLLAIGILCYVGGSIKFDTKDLPL